MMDAKVCGGFMKKLSLEGKFFFFFVCKGLLSSIIFYLAQKKWDELYVGEKSRKVAFIIIMMSGYLLCV